MLFDIAGIQLTSEDKNKLTLPAKFKAFISKKNSLNRNTWHLNAIILTKTKNIPSHEKQIAFYFNKSLLIDSKRKEISSLYFKNERSTTNHFDTRLLIFIYSQALCSDNGLLVHSAAVVKDKKAYLFFGLSGGGKTTVAALSKQYKVIGDDVIALRNINGKFFAFSTPWKQSRFVKISHKPHKVEAIFFIKKSKKISFSPLSQGEALLRILSRHIHFITLTKPPILNTAFFTAYDLAKSVPAFKMEFVKDKNFWPELIQFVSRT